MIGALTLDQLRVLVTVEETGSFSAAGRQLRRVQSAISHSIQTLEETQGVQLFDRRAHKPKLTETGRILAEQARQILHQAARFELTAQSINSGLEPELPIAMDSFVPTKPIIHALAKLQANYPNLAVTLYTEGMGAAERRVRNGTAAIGLCVLQPASAKDLQCTALTEITLQPVVAPTHPLAQETRPLSLNILAEHVQLILTDPLQRSTPSFGVVSNRVWRFVDIARRLEFLLAGFGWGTMPRHLIEPYLATGQLQVLRIDDPAVSPGSIGLFAIHERERPLGVGARALMEALQQQAWQGAD